MEADGSVNPRGKYNRLSEGIENSRTNYYGSPEEFSKSIDEIFIHPMAEALKEVCQKRGRCLFYGLDGSWLVITDL